MRQVLKPGSRTSKHEPQEADLGLAQRTRIWGIGVAGTLVTLSVLVADSMQRILCDIISLP